MVGTQDVPLHESVKDGVVVNCVYLTGLRGVRMARKTFLPDASVGVFSEKLNVCIYRLREAGGLYQ